MNKVKSIQQLYSEAKNYDIVLTVDASLARGLNNLIDTPRFALLASTPRQLAQSFADLHFDNLYTKFEFITLVSEETGKSFRLVHALTENILNVWNQSGLLELTDIHLTDEAKTIIPFFEKYPMTELAMQSFDEKFFTNKKIAVIEKEFFNELDLQVLPKNIFYDEINIFTGEKYSIDKTYLFGNTKTLIDNVTSLITPENAHSIAVALEPNSDYNILLQIRLKENGIAVRVKDSLRQSLIVRFMIGLIENSFEYDTLRAVDFKEAGKFFGFQINPAMDDYNIEVVINNYADKKLKSFYKLFIESSKFTFEKFTNELIERYSCELNDFLLLLHKTGFSNKKITEENLLELKYILDNFELEDEEKNKGVVFIDAKNSAFVNRDVVIYIGLDETWSISLNEKQYIDKQREDKINLNKFQVLLQQGSERLYLAQEIKDNSEVLPAPYFSIIENRSVTNLKDKIFNPVFIADENSTPENEDKMIEIFDAGEEVTGIAPTPLKKFIMCPAKYFYESHCRQKDAPYFLKGNLVHQFAEFYFQHPEFCRVNYQKIFEYILKHYSSVITKSELEIEQTNFRIALENIMVFLDEINIEKIAASGDLKEDNGLMKYFEMKKIYDYTEKDLPKDFILKGRADLRDKKTIVDYKSGSSRYKLKDLPKLINIDYIYENEDTDFDFQAISYLAALKNENFSEEKLKFIYNYVLANRKSLLDKRLKDEDNFTELNYIDLDFSQYLQTENCYEFVKENSHKDYKKYFDVLNFEAYKSIFDEIDLHEINFWDKESVSKILCREILRALAIQGFDYKSFRKKEERTYIEELRKAAEIFYTIRSNQGLIFKDDVKKFIDYVKKKLYELNLYRKNNYPAMPVFESNQVCKECEFLNMCRGNLLWN